MSTEANEGWYSAAELAELGAGGVHGIPATPRGCTIKAEREKWPQRQVAGKGGKGGVKTLYRVPPGLREVIRIVKEGGEPTATPNRLEQPPVREYGASPMPATIAPAPIRASLLAKLLAVALKRLPNGSPDEIAELVAEFYAEAITASTSAEDDKPRAA